MTLDEFLAEIHRANEIRPGVHSLAAGVTDREVVEWQRKHGICLPADLVELLRKTNGVAVHQQWFDGQPLFEGGAFKLYALQRIRPASLAMYGGNYSDSSMTSWWAIGEGPDGALFFIYDFGRETYLVVTPILPEEAEDLGPGITALLDRLEPRSDSWSA